MTEQLNEMINDLQSRLAFQDDAIEHLNKVVATQSQEIDLLKKQLAYLYEQLKEQIEKNAAGSFSELEIPPHY